MISDYYTQSAAFVNATTSTGWGSESGWSTSPSTFAAAINPVSGDVRLAGRKETLFATHKLFCSDTVAFAEGARVQYSGDTLDVVFVKDTLNKSHHKLAYLRDRNG